MTETEFMSESKIIKTENRPIIRFVGSHTVTSLYDFMEMTNTCVKVKQ